ncbi:MAG TPA: hypothetical protein VHG29_13550 [Novosphingobium sp.]|nr:hypothetical protein [Novosphingobium sp.]
MVSIEVKITGSRKWLAGIIEDHHGGVNPLDFQQDVARIGVAAGGPAWLSLYFWGNPGDEIKAEISKGDLSLAKRSYKIDPDGSAARAIQFDPDA